MKVKEALKKFGMKNAYAQVDSNSLHRGNYEPKPPAKIQEKMNQKKSI